MDSPLNVDLNSSFGSAVVSEALKSRCCAKELMQASPDMESSFAVDPAAARALMATSQRRIYHNLCLAAYLTTSLGSLAPNDQIIWNEVVLSLKDDQRNREHQELWNHVSSVFPQ